MRAPWNLCMLGILASTITGCQAAPASLSDIDLRDLQGNLDAHSELVLSRNAEGLAAMYAEDGMLIMPDEPNVVGIDAVRNWYEQVWETAPEFEEYRLTAEQIDGRGDLAFIQGTYSLTFQPEGEIEPRTARGNYVSIQRREYDGVWRIVVDIFSQLPPPHATVCFKSEIKGLRVGIVKGDDIDWLLYTDDLWQVPIVFDEFIWWDADRDAVVCQGTKTLLDRQRLTAMCTGRGDTLTWTPLPVGDPCQ